MKKLLGVVSLLFGLGLGAWIGYNYLVERQPEARGSCTRGRSGCARGSFPASLVPRVRTRQPVRMPLSPIVLDYPLRVAPARAFEIYAQRIGEWWPAQYSRDAAGFTGVTIEPFVGGRVYARFRDGSDDDWGRVLTYEPGRRLRHTFTLAQPPETPSEIDVTFEARSEGGCTMHFAHGGWNERNVALRAKFREWAVILDRFAALAEA